MFEQEKRAIANAMFNTLFFVICCFYFFDLLCYNDPNPNKDFGMENTHRLKIKITIKNNFENTNIQTRS
jgi:hypothetical protein